MKVQSYSFPFPVTVRRSTRARRMAIHIEASGEVELVLPRAATHKDGVIFLQERTKWIMNVLRRQDMSSRIAPAFRIESGATLPCFGNTIRLDIAVETDRIKSFVREQGGVLRVRVGDIKKAHSAIANWYIVRAKQYCLQQVHADAVILHKPFRTVRAVNMKTQWGSCNHRTGVLTFNWRLALAPEYIARYVIAHEVAHLVHPNHSQRFWKTVSMLDPSYATARAWLRVHGGSLRFVP